MWGILLISLTAVQLLFTIISLIAADEEKDVLLNMYWTKVHGEGNSYWGLFSEYQTKYGEGVIDYDKCDENVCNDCATAGQVVVAFSVLTMVIAIVSIVFYSLRYCMPSFNTKIYKGVTIATAAATLLTSGLTIIVFGSQCQANLYNHFNDCTVTMGPGYGLALGVVIISLMIIPVDIFLNFTSPPSSLNAPLNPSAPYISNGFTDAGVMSVNPLMGGPRPSPPVHCSFCGKLGAREFPSHPNETTRFCSVCGKRHIIEEGLKFCSSCGTELKL